VRPTAAARNFVDMIYSSYKLIISYSQLNRSAFEQALALLFQIPCLRVLIQEFIERFLLR
jgi:hypothetical protein